jgi:hypothetical protein
MRAVIRPIFIALSFSSMAALTLAAPTGAAFAQNAPAGAPEEAQKEIALTDKQIDNVLAAKPDIEAILAKLPQGNDQAQPAPPDPKIVAQLDAAAKKHGFANYAEYDDVDANIGLVMAGFDPQTKKYVGDEIVIKKEIAEAQADKKMAPADKKEELAQLNEIDQAAAISRQCPDRGQILRQARRGHAAGPAIAGRLSLSPRAGGMRS